jgi:hypothetical protein
MKANIGARIRVNECKRRVRQGRSATYARPMPHAVDAAGLLALGREAIEG